jgi:hypothetical protein
MTGNDAIGLDRALRRTFGTAPPSTPDMARGTEGEGDPLDPLPDSARLWIFGVSRPLDDREEALLLGRVDAFIAQWAAHGHPLAAARAWRGGRFLLVAVDDRITPPSGCSTDALVRALRRLEEELAVEMVGNAPVWFRGRDGLPARVSRPRFRELAGTGEIDLETPVFDLSLTRLGELREGRFEGPARDHWHRRLVE